MAVICYANDPPKTDTFGSSSFPKVPAFILITEMSQRNLRFLIDLLPFYFRVLQPEPKYALHHQKARFNTYAR